MAGLRITGTIEVGHVRIVRVTKRGVLVEVVVPGKPYRHEWLEPEDRVSFKHDLDLPLIVTGE